MGRSSICIVEIGLKTNNQQLKANDCHYKLSLLKEKVCPNNQPYLSSNPAATIVCEVS
jgi:hypothetical protein